MFGRLLVKIQFLQVSLFLGRICSEKLQGRNGGRRIGNQQDAGGLVL